MSVPLKISLSFAVIHAAIYLIHPFVYNLPIFLVDYPFFLIYSYIFERSLVGGFLNLAVIFILGTVFYAGLGYLVGIIIQKDLNYLEEHGVQHDKKKG